MSVLEQVGLTLPRFITGWRLIHQRMKFMFGWGRYLIQRARYPLFRLFPLRSGVLNTVKIIHDIGIRKIVEFDGAYYSSLTVPHNPSPAYDRMIANGGLNIGAAGTPLKKQIDTLLLAITQECDLHCQHCYERHNIGHGSEVPVNRIKEIVNQVQQHGVSSLVLTGGEPMNRFDDLLEIVRSADKNLSDIHLHTSGRGVTPERAAALRQAGLTWAAVGLDGPDRTLHDTVRGVEGAFDEAVRALRIFRSAGVLPYVNVCATPELVRNVGLWRYAEFAKEQGVAFIQLLEPRPCGGYINAPGEMFLTEEDRKQVAGFFCAINGQKKYRDYPMVHYVAYAESPARLGCMMGGLSHMYIDSRGNVNPCVFLPVTFGNIQEEDFEEIYGRMRKAIPRPLHAECPSLQLHATLRRKKAEDSLMPLPYSAVKNEWQNMFSN
jgi:MoaA/NifB/PqqE/SkfB family radical SAM enzyme